MENKVLYVWFDACIGYPSITANYTDEWEKWWRNPEDVQLWQFMGKDNVPFHSVIFPGTQIGTQDKWTMLHHLSTTEYLNYEGGKFSKSRGVGVFGTNAKETGVSADVWRYYLLKNRPETGDTQFEWLPFVEANNGELLAKYGNLVNRVIKLVTASYGSVIPEFSTPDSFAPFLEEVTGHLRQYHQDMEGAHLRAGVATAMRIAEAGNGLIQANRLDNKLIAEEPELAAAVVGTVLNLIHLLSAVFAPYMPASSESILKQLDAPFLTIPSGESLENGWKPTSLKAGHKIGKAAYLFTRIDPKKAEEWRELFGGSQADRKKKEEEAAKLAAKKAAAKAKKKEKKEKGRAGAGGEGGVEGSAKGGAEKISATTDGKNDEAVEKIADGVAQVTLPTS
jgi:methionyl-tRNA synthetase